MNLLTQHPHDQGISYNEHWEFAMGIAWRLFRSVIAFVLHAILPCFSIDKEFDLEATSAFLLQQNDFIESAAQSARTDREVRPLAA